MFLTAAERGTKRGNQKHEHVTGRQCLFYISVSQPFLPVVTSKWLTTALHLVPGTAGMPSWGPIPVPVKCDPVEHSSIISIK